MIQQADTLVQIASDIVETVTNPNFANTS
jgi:hypothetical protein